MKRNVKLTNLTLSAAPLPWNTRVQRGYLFFQITCKRELSLQHPLNTFTRAKTEAPVREPGPTSLCFLHQLWFLLILIHKRGASVLVSRVIHRSDRVAPWLTAQPPTCQGLGPHTGGAGDVEGPVAEPVAEVCPSWDRKNLDTLHLTVDACARFCTHQCRVFVCVLVWVLFLFSGGFLFLIFMSYNVPCPLKVST